MANRVSPVELPPDNYFANVAELFGKIEGMDTLLSDPAITSVRLVTNPERMVLRETQRTFVYFSLHGLTVDAILINRVLPDIVSDTFFSEWRASQQAVLAEMKEYFAPVPVHHVPLFTHEVLGRQRLEELARALYSEGDDPAAVVRPERAYTFEKTENCWEVRLDMPFTRKRRSACLRKAMNWWSK